MIPCLYENFQYWSDGGSVYLLSDTHFGDSKCKQMDKHWISPEKHIEIINKVIHKNDTLILLGDVGNLDYVKQIKAGRKILIKGNHDDGILKYKEVFNEVYDGALFIGEKILLSHEPVYGLQWCVNIHGHVHDGLPHKKDKYHLNVASPVIGWKPVSLGVLIKQGLTGKIPSVHRITVDNAIERKKFRNK